MTAARISSGRERRGSRMWERKPQQRGVFMGSCRGERDLRWDSEQLLQQRRARETPQGGGKVLCWSIAHQDGGGRALPLPGAVPHGWVVVAQTWHWPTQNRDWEEPLTAPAVPTWCQLAPETGGWPQNHRASRCHSGCCWNTAPVQRVGPVR